MKFRGRDQQGWGRNEAESEIRITDRRRRFLHEDDPEAAAAKPAEPNLKPSYVEELETRTRNAEQLAQDVQARFEKLKAKLQQETDETRQRLNRAADERTERGKAQFIASLLPVLDNLERAIEAADVAEGTDQLTAGVKQTAESFKNALTDAGVEPLISLGETFDPQLHEAVESVLAEPEDDGKVVAEYTRGYRIGDRLLRPARVAVGQAEAKAQSAND
jgi:molecular chaperone GrpE